MPASPPFTAVLADVFCCLGLGLGLGAMRDLAGLVLGCGRWREFVCDLLAFTVAAVLLFGYAAGCSAVGVIRWYMVAGMGLGGFGWHWSGGPVLHRAAQAAARFLTGPPRWLRRRISLPLKERKEKRKHIKNAEKEKKRLQKQQKMIYN